MKSKLAIIVSIFILSILCFSHFKSQAQDSIITYHKNEKLLGKIKNIVENEKCLEYKFWLFQKEYYNSTYEYKYNKEGKLVEKISYDYNVLGVNYTNYKYDERGNKIEITTKNNSGISKSIYIYDTNNNLIEKKNPLDTFNYKYDNRGNVIEVKERVFNTHVFIKYNDKNKIVKIETYNNDKLSSIDEIEYINNNKQYQELTYTDSILSKEAIRNYKNDSTLKDETIIEYYTNISDLDSCYLRRIMSKEIKTYQKDTVLLENRKYEYDEEGNETSIEIRKYDDRSRLIYYENIFKDQAGEYKYLYKYNDRDEIIEQTSFIVNDPNPNIEKFKYKYDKKGNWIKKIIKDKYSKAIFTRKIEYYQ